MWDEILTTLWFFAPAGFANMAPIFAANLHFLKKYNKAIDGGRTFRGKRLFGDNKTYRGFVAGIIIAYITLIWQKILVANGSWPIDNTWFDYQSENLILLGFAFGFGALAGDAIKSFFKRQFGKKPGASWPPFDQIDYVLGGLLLAGPMLSLSLENSFKVFVIFIILHPISTFIGWLLRLKDKPL